MKYLRFPLVLGFLVAFSAAAQDVVTVGSVTTNNSTVDIPLSIRDTSGTSLGLDRPAGSRIQSYSLRVNYSPASAVSSVTFTRSGITSSLSPTFESSPSTAGSISLIDTFQESSNLIPFTLNAPPPGDKVAHLVFTLSGSATPGSSISLTLDPTLTQLTDEGGTAATKETQGNGGLTLVNGTITIPQFTVTLTPPSLSTELHSISAAMAVTLSAATPSTIQVALSSSAPNVAAIPSSVTIAAGSTTGNFSIDPLAIGSSTITATLPPGSGGATGHGTVDVVAPHISFAPLRQTASVGGTATLTLTISTPQPTNTNVALASSDSTIVTVPASVTIPAGQKTATVTVNGIKVGSANVQATLPQAVGAGTANATLDVVVGCSTPSAPSISVSSDAFSGAAYDVTWSAVSGASDYAVDESTDAAFASPSTTTVSAAKATFTHVVTTDTRYFYRVRSRNKSGSCDVASSNSNSVSILVHASTGPAMAILPVVGSAQGAFGSLFKTSLQLYNAQNATISGRIVYHAGGSSGSSTDPSIVYSLAAHKTITYDDLLGNLSLTGVGSADIVADGNTPLPIAAARVFNDAGTAGTSGFGEDAMTAAGALHNGDSAVLIAPPDFTRFRMNVGIRTLDEGASMTITARDKDGIVLRSVDKAYDPTFFTQGGAGGYLDGLTLTGGETITFTITSGSVIIYGSITDNATNDPTLQLAHKAN